MLLGFLGVSLFGNAAPLRWSDALNDPSRWSGYDVIAGKWTFLTNEADKSICFESDFSGVRNGDFRFYPLFSLFPMETLKGAEKLSFEIQTAEGGLSEGFVILKGTSGKEEKIPFILPENGQYKTIEISLKPFESELDQVKSIQVGFKAKSGKVVWNLRNVKVDGQENGVRQIESSDVQLAVRPAAAAGMFYESEPLKFTAVIPGTAAYTVKDIHGKVVRTGTMKPGEFQLEKLPRGYYFLTLQSSGQNYIRRARFTVVSDRRKLPDGKVSNYSVSLASNTARSNIRWGRELLYSGGIIHILPEVCARAGLFTVREHTHWLEPSPGKYDFGEARKVAELLAARDIWLTDMIVGCPRWAANDKFPVAEEMKRHLRLPGDLRYVFSYARGHIGSFKGLVRYSEFWNEPDAGGANAAWNYAAAMKAAFLGYRLGNSKAKVLSGSFVTKAYAEVALKSDMAEYFDIFNFHSYAPVYALAKDMRELKEMLADSGADGRPMVCTELGTTFLGEPTEHCYRKGGAKERNDSQDLLYCEFIVKSQIILQSEGLNVGYTFFLPPGANASLGSIGCIDWGMMGYDKSAKPALTVFSTLSHELASADYLGTFNTVPEVRGFLFAQPDGTQSLALWKISNLETQPGTIKYQPDAGTKISIPQENGHYRFSDAFGTPSALEATDGKLEVSVTNQVCYVSGLRGLKPSTPFVPRTAVLSPNPQLDKTVVVNIVTGPDLPISTVRLYAELKKPTVDIALHIYNFSNEEKTGMVEFGGAKVEGAKKVTLPPHGMIQMKLTVTPEVHPGRLLTDFVVNGVFNGKRISRAVMPILIPDAITKTVKLSGADSEKNWRNSWLCTMTKADSPSDNAVVFKAGFKKPHGYIYPEYVLQNGESLEGAVGLQFEMWLDPATGKAGLDDKRIILYDTLDGHNGGTLIMYDAPMDGNWAKVKAFFAYKVKDPAAIRRIAIGLIPKTMQVEYKIRNIEMLMQK